MSTRASGRFEVTAWDEQTYHEFEGGAKLARAKVSATFQGDIAGEGISESLLMYADDGFCSFVGMQQITGTIQGRPGSFVLQTSGTYADGTTQARWFVVPGSGTGELQNLKGQGGYLAKRDEYPNVSITLDYDLGG